MKKTLLIAAISIFALAAPAFEAIQAHFET
jgi:hypothetical protein